MISIDLRSFEPKVISVYSGKPNCCCCGCAGKHTYSSRSKVSMRSNAAVVKDSVVKSVITKMARLVANAGAKVFISADHISVTTLTRVYVMYLDY